MYSMIISLITYVISYYYIGKFMDDYLDRSSKRLVVFILASFISWLVGSAIDWAFPSQAISLF